jgi:hypothetical protein
MYSHQVYFHLMHADSTRLTPSQSQSRRHHDAQVSSVHQCPRGTRVPNAIGPIGKGIAFVAGVECVCRQSAGRPADGNPWPRTVLLNGVSRPHGFCSISQSKGRTNVPGTSRNVLGTLGPLPEFGSPPTKPRDAKRGVALTKTGATSRAFFWSSMARYSRHENPRHGGRRCGKRDLEFVAYDFLYRPEYIRAYSRTTSTYVIFFTVARVCYDVGTCRS